MDSVRKEKGRGNIFCKTNYFRRGSTPFDVLLADKSEMATKEENDVPCAMCHVFPVHGIESNSPFDPSCWNS